MTPASAAHNSRRAAIALAATIVATQLAWGNLTWLRLWRYPFTYDEVALPRLVAASVGVALVWLLLAIGPFHRRVVVHPAWSISVALAVAAFASGVLSRQSTDVWLGQSERLEGVFTIALYAALLGAGLQVGRNSNNVRVIAHGLVGSSTALAVYGIIQALGFDPARHDLASYGFPLTHAFSSLGNPNFLAGALVLALPPAVGLALEARSRVRAAWAACSFTMLAALVLTRSEGGWLAAVVVAGIAVGLYVAARARERDMPARRVAITATAAGAGIVALAVAAVAAAAAISPAYRVAIVGSAKGRAGLALAALEAMARRPITGYGPDAFMAALRMHRPDTYVEVFGKTLVQNNAHSWILQYLATLGIVGGMLLAVLLIVGLWSARPPADSTDASAPILRRAVWLGLLGYVVHLQGSVAMLAVTVPFWVLLGALIAPRGRERELTGRARSVAMVASAVLLVAFAVAGVRLLAADYHFLTSRFIYHRMAPGNAVTEARTAQRLNPLSVKYSRGESQAWIRETVVEAGRTDAEKADVKKLYRQADTSLRRTFEKSPHDYATMAWYAGFNAEMSKRLGEEPLARNAAIMALIATKDDRFALEVYRLAERDTSTPTINAALTVPPLP